MYSTIYLLSFTGNMTTLAYVFFYALESLADWESSLVRCRFVGVAPPQTKSKLCCLS